MVGGEKVSVVERSDTLTYLQLFGRKEGKKSSDAFRSKVLTYYLQFLLKVRFERI